MATIPVNSSTFSKDTSSSTNNVYYLQVTGISTRVARDTIKTLTFSFDTNSIDTARTVTVTVYGTQGIRTVDGRGISSYNALADVRTHTFNKPGNSNLLVKSDATSASILAKDLLTSIESVNMNELDGSSHEQWMKVNAELKEDAEHINETKEIAHQRDHFITLSKNLFSVIKVSKVGTPVFYQFCPMANKGKGANWLSLENKIKNPYYGNQMLTCGRVMETIQ